MNQTVEYRIPPAIILVGEGDITKLDVEAIVNPANSHLTMGGGVAGAIKRAGGMVIEEEALKKAPVPIGRAIATSAGGLKARYVIHSPTMEVPGPTTAENVYAAVRAALKCAEELGVRSLTVPGMGTGVGGVSPEDSAKTMVEALLHHLEDVTSLTTLRRVYLMDIDKQMVSMFNEHLQRLRTRGFV